MEYNLINISHSKYIYCEIQKGMYVLPQAVILANQQLVQRLEPKGYLTWKHTPGLWRHKWRPIKFSLVVDEFGVKYIGKQHADHLINCIREHYQVSIDWEGQQYFVRSIKWNYQKQVVDLSMPSISKRHCTGSNTVHQQENKIHRIAGNNIIMEQPINSPMQRTHHKNFPQNVSWYYSKSHGRYFFMPK